MKNLSISKPFGGADIKLKSKLLKLSGVIFIFAVCVMLCFALYYLIDDTLNGSFVNWFDENYIITIEKDLTGLPVQNAPERRLNYPKIKELLLQVLVVSVTAWIAIVLTVAHFYSRSREKRSVTAVSRMIQRFMNTDTDAANIFPKEYAEISAQMTDEFYPLLQKHGNCIELNVEENTIVFGDAEKLARVFNNILKNAIAYSYPGSGILLWAEQNDTEIRIYFQNKGKTIPPHKLDSIFEKFFRLDEARATNTGGAGLGLAIAKEIITLHGGSITAVSKDEKTVFCVSLPLYDQ